jgi:hypothetical protein
MLAYANFCLIYTFESFNGLYNSISKRLIALNEIYVYHYLWYLLFEKVRKASFKILYTSSNQVWNVSYSNYQQATANDPE